MQTGLLDDEAELQDLTKQRKVFIWIGKLLGHQKDISGLQSAIFITLVELCFKNTAIK